MVNKQPLSRVVGPLPNGFFMANKWWLVVTDWDDPPSLPWINSKLLKVPFHIQESGFPCPKKVGKLPPTQVK